MDTRDVKTGILHKCKIQSRNVRQINGLHFGFLLFRNCKKGTELFYEKQ